MNRGMKRGAVGLSADLSFGALEEEEQQTEKDWCCGLRVYGLPTAVWRQTCVACVSQHG